ncbi:unnamed protein product, partial [Didymodactylos carnosus]
FALLEFENEQVAEKNHAKLQGKQIRTWKIQVDFVGEKSKFEKKTDFALDKKQLYISPIKETVTVSQMKQLYPKSKFVKLQKRKVGKNKVIQFAFVTFDGEKDAEQALIAHTEIGGEKIHVSYAREQKPQQQKTADETSGPQKQQQKKQPEQEFVMNAIYVGQIPEHVEESEIKKLFPKSTNIEFFPAQPRKQGVRLGHAFVVFSDDASAAAAIKQGPSLTLKQAQLKISYRTKRAEPPKRPLQQEQTTPTNAKKQKVEKSETETQIKKQQQTTPNTPQQSVKKAQQ